MEEKRYFIVFYVLLGEIRDTFASIAMYTDFGYPKHFPLEIQIEEVIGFDGDVTITNIVELTCSDWEKWAEEENPILYYIP